MKKILVLKEKHGDRYIGPYEKVAEREDLANKIVRERLKEGYWYTQEAEESGAIQAVDSNRCWEFLVQRSRYEYEDIAEYYLEGL